jgi:hypothetical protein
MRARVVATPFAKISPATGRARILPSFCFHFKATREAERRQACSPTSAPRKQVYAVCANPSASRGARSAERAAYRRSTAALARGTFVPLAAAPGQASWDVAAISRPFARRALPAPACPSPVKAPHAPAVVPASMMPKAARERNVSFRPQAPHSLRFREYLRERRPSMSEIFRLVPEMGTNVKECRVVSDGYLVAAELDVKIASKQESAWVRGSACRQT